MAMILRSALSALALVATASAGMAQSGSRDGIGDLLRNQTTPPGKVAPKAVPGAAAPAPAPTAPEPQAERDPREGDASFEQAKKLMAAIDAILQDTAKNRGEAKKLPSKDEFMITPLWTETKEDRERKIRDLLEAALGIVTDVPVVDVQKKVEERRKVLGHLLRQSPQIWRRKKGKRDKLIIGCNESFAMFSLCLPRE